MNKHLFSTWKSICFCNLFLLTVGLQVVFQSIWNTTSCLSSRTNLVQHKWQGPILTSQGLRDWKPKPTWWPPIGHPHSHHTMLVMLGHKRPCLNSGLSHAVSATMRNNTPISNIVWQTQSVIPDSDHWINYTRHSQCCHAPLYWHLQRCCNLCRKYYDHAQSFV